MNTYQIGRLIGMICLGAYGLALIIALLRADYFNVVLLILTGIFIFELVRKPNSKGTTVKRWQNEKGF